MADKDRINITALLDQCLGFSIKDLVLTTPEGKAEFGRRLDEALKKALAEEAEAEKEGKKPLTEKKSS